MATKTKKQAESTGKFRICCTQFGYPMYACSLLNVNWSDVIAESAVYDYRDCRETKLLWWRAVASNAGLDPKTVQIVEAE